MSLLRLLAAGKSLVGLKRAPARYHLSRQGALPQFGGKENPFRATARPALSRAAATETVAESKAENHATPALPSQQASPPEQSQSPVLPPTA